MMKFLLPAACAAFAIASPSWAEIAILDAYARANAPAARAGAAYMIIENTGPEADRLMFATSSAAVRVQLHTHIEGDDEVMTMRHIKGGIEIPAGSQHTLKRGGDHLMLMGAIRKWNHGDMIPVTLMFEKSGEMTLEIPIDLERVTEGFSE